MSRETIIVLFAIAIAVLMILFPPWSVRERKFSAAFEPEHAGRYAFIASPPNAALSGGWTTVVATVDMSRLLIQFVGLALVTGGTIMVLRKPLCRRQTINSDENGVKLRAG